MNHYERGIAVGRSFVRTSTSFDLNEAIRAVTVSHPGNSNFRGVSLSMDLADRLPRTAADSDRVQSVLAFLFAVAQRSVSESGSFDRDVHVRSEVVDGRVQCSITFATKADGLRALSTAACEGVHANPELSICAEIIQDEGGEFYAWRPSVLTQMTMVVDLPF